MIAPRTLPSQLLTMLRPPQRLTLAQALGEGLQVDAQLRERGYADGAAGRPRDPDRVFSLGYMGGYLDGSRYGRRKEG
jgi:hypothetical protein